MPGRRKRAAFAAAALTLGAAAFAPQAAIADVLAPDSPASPQAGATWWAYVIFGAISLLVALGVIGAVLRAVGRGRGESGPERRTRGGAGIQRRVGFGLGGAVLVLFVVAVIFTESARDVEASSDDAAAPIAIQVDGQQWVWRYEYPEATDTSDTYSSETPYSFYELVVPVDTPIVLDVSSTDVRHRWWVPALGRQVDAVPGEDNEFTFVTDEIGTYEGRSTEYSGPGFATMRTVVRVVELEEYEAYLEERIAAIVESREGVQAEIEAGTAPGASGE